MNLDEKYLRILELLERDSKLTVKQIAKAVKLPATTVHNRIKRLEEAGIIKGYTAVLDREKLGMNVSAFIFISVSQPAARKVSQQEICRKLVARKEIESASIITGTKDIIARIRVESISKLNQFITNYLRNIEGIDKTETMIVLEEIR